MPSPTIPTLPQSVMMLRMGPLLVSPTDEGWRRGKLTFSSRIPTKSPSVGMMVRMLLDEG